MYYLYENIFSPPDISAPTITPILSRGSVVKTITKDIEASRRIDNLEFLLKKYRQEVTRLVETMNKRE